MKATDYISRQEALRAICDKQRDHTHWKSNYELGKYQGANGYVDAIKAVPAADVVEVVRCKDCDTYNSSGCPDGFGVCLAPDLYGVCVENDFFCKYGRRADDGNEG